MKVQQLFDETGAPHTIMLEGEDGRVFLPNDRALPFVSVYFPVTLNNLRGCFEIGGGSLDTPRIITLACPNIPLRLLSFGDIQEKVYDRLIIIQRPLSVRLQELHQ